MANLFGLPSPDEVRQNTRRRMFGQAPQMFGTGAQGFGGILGMALGSAARDKWGKPSADVTRAQNVQSILNQTIADIGADPKSMDMAGMQQLGTAYAKNLLKGGELDLGLNVMKSLQDMGTAAGTVTDREKFKQSKLKVLRTDVKGASAKMRIIDDAYGKIKDSFTRKNSPVSDMSMVFGIMKIFDPNSTVREGEYATAKNTTGIPGVILNAYEQARTGKILNDDQRRLFLQEAKGLRDVTRKSTDVQIGDILEQADQDKVGRERVLGSTRYKAYQERRKKASKNDPLGLL